MNDLKLYIRIHFISGTYNVSLLQPCLHIFQKRFVIICVIGKSPNFDVDSAPARVSNLFVLHQRRQIFQIGAILVCQKETGPPHRIEEFTCRTGSRTSRWAEESDKVGDRVTEGS